MVSILLHHGICHKTCICTHHQPSDPSGPSHFNWLIFLALPILLIVIRSVSTSPSSQESSEWCLCYHIMATLDIVQTYVLIFYLVILLALPILLIVIRSVSLKNYPVFDLFLLYNSIVFYAQIIFYACAIHFWGNHFLFLQFVYFRFLGDLLPWFWLIDVMSFIFILNVIMGIVGFIITDVSLINGCAGKTKQHNSIPRERTSEEIRKYIQVLTETGPTLVRGEMVRTGYKCWGCKWWSQFEYKSWRNVSITGSKAVERWMCKEDGKKSFMIRIHVEIEPGDGETKKQYEEWCPKLGPLQKLLVLFPTKFRAMPLSEEIITIPALKHSHKPLKDLREIQFPKLFKIGEERWPFSKNTIFFNKPTAFNKLDSH